MENRQQRYPDINAGVIDQWAASGWEWGRPIDHETFARARQGEWNVLLTPTRPVPHDWLGDLRGRKVLGLASGGGQQMPIFAALGAQCTVLDYSPVQLESERRLARQEGYAMEIVHADMTRPLPFEAERFDLIFHPVSNCYVEDVYSIWRECFRVLKKGGVLLAGLDNGINFVYGEEGDDQMRYRLPYNPLKDAALYEASLRNNWGIQFSHTIEEQVGGQLKAGFVLADIYQDTNGSGRLHDFNVPAFFATRAVKAPAEGKMR